MSVTVGEICRRETVKRQAVIGMVAAMPEEIGPLLGQMQQIRKETVEGYRLYRFETGGQHVCLVESGMGPTHAATATRILIDAVQPSLIVNFGFAGALAPDLQVGDIVLANRLLFLHERLFSEQQGLSQAVTERIDAFLAGCTETVSHRTTFVTAGKIVAKKELALRLPAGAALSVIEMETSAVARIAYRDGTPLVAVRAISDGFNEELGFSLDEFCDRNLRLQIWRVILTVGKKPWIIPQLLRLARNSRSAGSKLGYVLQRLLAEDILA